MAVYFKIFSSSWFLFKRQKAQSNKLSKFWRLLKIWLQIHNWKASKHWNLSSWKKTKFRKWRSEWRLKTFKQGRGDDFWRWLGLRLLDGAFNESDLKSFNDEASWCGNYVKQRYDCGRRWNESGFKSCVLRSCKSAHFKSLSIRFDRILKVLGNSSHKSTL